MTGEFVVALDHDTGQLTMTGRPAGPAGGAILTPAPGLDLLFDRCSGRLCRLTIDLPDVGRRRHDHEPGRQRMLVRLFGVASARAIRRARAAPEVEPEPAVLDALSRLALFDAARATSPVSAASPLWPAEAAVLAERAGLRERAEAEAASATDLARLAARMPLPGVLAPVVAGTSRLASTSQPDASQVLRDGVKWFDGSLAAWLAEFGPAIPDLLEVQAPDRPAPAGHWALDLASVPAGLLTPGLTPDVDMVSHLDCADVLVVEGRLGPGADLEALSRCRVRLVDPEDRRIISQAPLTADGLKARACLPVRGSRPELSRTWLEVVAADDAPVRGTTLRTVRLALRWADTALRAERRPHGLARDLSDDGWTRLADRGWEQCRLHWESAGNPERAGQLKDLSRSPRPGYLAETVGALL